jgi:translation elongation factor EF-Ts
MSETIEDLIAKTTEGDFVASNNIFGELMQSKINDAMEQEKIRVAGQIYNGLEPEEMADDQLELDLEDEEEQLELDLEDET